MKHNQPINWYWLRDRNGKWHGAYDKQVATVRHRAVMAPYALHGGGRSVCAKPMSKRPRDSKYAPDSHICEKCLPEIANQVLLRSVEPRYVMRVDPALTPLAEGVTPTGMSLNRTQWVDVKELNDAFVNAFVDVGQIGIYSGTPSDVGEPTV